MELIALIQAARGVTLLGRVPEVAGEGAVAHVCVGVVVEEPGEEVLVVPARLAEGRADLGRAGRRRVQLRVGRVAGLVLVQTLGCGNERKRLL